jgi:hypothetical protein
MRPSSAALRITVLANAASALLSPLSVSQETTRSNLKRIFRKCHVASQLELVALMQRISSCCRELPLGHPIAFGNGLMRRS